MKVKIAVVQFKIEQFKPEINLLRAENFIKKASIKEADIIVFPEDFLTGPILSKREFADSQNKYKCIFQSMAKKYKIDIVPGSIIEEEKGGLFNVSYYIDKIGKIRGRYKKINLWWTERKYLLPGNEISVFNTQYGKIGLIICWDLVFPEIFRKMLIKRVRIVICPSYWCYGDAGIGIKFDKNSEIKMVDSLCVARAFENEIVLIYCNAAGEFKIGKFKDRLIGHSQIALPFKGIIKKLNHNREEMFIEEVDMNILKSAERIYGIRKDKNYNLF
ncbi:MAG: carbon-nitrogen hydrolase family protein [Patescibacteria group bacterium]|nr:carbon-nitrogen hydrolase family protein [Patescibacteria group bacterium]